ncbi:hypothetical protein [Shewanella algae]|uniref:hypothetical protein n=1 Tax=Shewanella algae TaxID=38313 RepID=UPI001AADCC70|nr:hypothetical protein [Shewanella algae]MBO2658648.1 hypothetical protein [Shewanella algae]
MKKSYKQRLIRKKARIKRRKIKDKSKNHSTTPIKKSGSCFLLGPKSDYRISEKSLSHIVNGDFTERLIEENDRRTGKKEVILSGGLHTAKAWVDFKNKRQDITHLRFYCEGRDKYWYYARELHNNVITLKIPKDLFQKQAAKITEFPETYYKSGFLWKTLFPKDKSNQDILSIINEALHYVDTEDSSENLIIGYGLLSNPFTAIKVRIQHRNKEIFSAFPTWDQPMIGNNGKAYSHLDSTSFIMALSTEFFDENDKVYHPVDSKIFIPQLGLESLINNTPAVFLQRPVLPSATNKREWLLSRIEHLRDYSIQCDEEDIKKINEYLIDPLILKDGFHLQRDIYNDIQTFKDIRKFNAITVFQNIYESLLVLFHFDQHNKTSFFRNSLPKVILSKVTFSGYIDSWQNKVLHSRIIDMVSDYHDKDIISEYLGSISKSPTRNDFFIDFDLNVYWKESIDIKTHEDAIKLSLMHNPSAKVEFRARHFEDYIYNNLSENYYQCFSAEHLKELTRRIISNQGKNAEQLVQDTVSLTTENDFEFFSEKYSRLVNRIFTDKVGNIPEETLSVLCKDVFRVQTACRMKVLMRNPSFDVNNIDYGNPTSRKYFNDIITKHERRLNVIMLESFFDNTMRIAEENSFTKLQNKLTSMKGRVWNERPPFAKPVPKPYRFWEKLKNKPWVQDKPTIDMIFPKPA